MNNLKNCTFEKKKMIEKPYIGCQFEEFIKLFKNDHHLGEFLFGK